MKQFLFIVCFFAMGYLAMAQGGQSKKVLADKIIAVIGDKIVLKSDITNYIEDEKRQGHEVPPDAGCMLLQQMMVRKALMLQAQKDSLPVSDEEIEAELVSVSDIISARMAVKKRWNKLQAKASTRLKKTTALLLKSRNSLMLCKNLLLKM